MMPELRRCIDQGQRRRHEALQPILREMARAREEAFGPVLREMSRVHRRLDALHGSLRSS